MGPAGGGGLRAGGPCSRGRRWDGAGLVVVWFLVGLSLLCWAPPAELAWGRGDWVMLAVWSVACGFWPLALVFDKMGWSL
jgi:hypothetical protein